MKVTFSDKLQLQLGQRPRTAIFIFKSALSAQMYYTILNNILCTLS